MLERALLLWRDYFMTGFRIVCAHDGLKSGEALMRLLSAEQFSVELSYGRSSLDHLENARESGEGVILIWSLDAPTAIYMLEWAHGIDPSRLAEIARARRSPKIENRVAPVLDFSAWNGERGGPAWRALTQRLRAIEKAMEPPKPPPVRAAMALAMLAVFAMVGALFDRFHGPVDTNVATNAAPETTLAALEPTPASRLPEEGRGGPIAPPEEPASFNMDAVAFGPMAHHAAAIAAPHDSLTQIDTAPPMEFHDPSLFDRVGDFMRDHQQNENN